MPVLAWQARREHCAAARRSGPTTGRAVCGQRKCHCPCPDSGRILFLWVAWQEMNGNEQYLNSRCWRRLTGRLFVPAALSPGSIRAILFHPPRRYQEPLDSMPDISGFALFFGNSASTARPAATVTCLITRRAWRWPRPGSSLSPNCVGPCTGNSCSMLDVADALSLSLALHSQRRREVSPHCDSRGKIGRQIFAPTPTRTGSRTGAADGGTRRRWQDRPENARAEDLSPNTPAETRDKPQP